MLFRIALALGLLTLSVYPASAADLWRPKGQPAFVDANGDPYSGAKLCYFDAGTSNETSVYKDADAQEVWAQPIELNSGGGLDSPIYVQTGAFKEKLMASTATDCTDTALYTDDEIPGAVDIDSLEVDFARAQMPVLSKAADYPVVSGDLGKLINVDATGGAVTISLPSASDAGDGALLAVRKTDSSANAVTISPSGVDTINGSASHALSQQYARAYIVSNGSIWSIVSASTLPLLSVGTSQLAATSVTFAKLNADVYSTDGTLAANSDGVLPTQKATKTYVDTAFASGVKWKEPVRVATTADGTLATAFDNGSTIDGVVLATSDRILIKNQSATEVNGIYTVAASGAPVRATDADTEAELIGATVYVEEGTANAATQWTQTETSITLETDPVGFVLIAAANTYTADAVTLQVSANIFSVKTDGISAGQIGAGQVGTSEIATDGVDSAEIASNAVGSAEIAALAVDTGELSAAVSNRLRDVGEVITYAGTTCPTFSLEANGAAINRTTYSDLFTALSTRYGVGNGSTTFNLPDYRGYFLRGWDHAAGNDPDAASRTNAGGGDTGDNMGTKQGSANLSHSHNLSIRDTGDDQSITTGSGSAADDSNSSEATTSSGGSEARPKNINVLYCIYAGA
jgi:microcystin-dependent protein